MCLFVKPGGDGLSEPAFWPVIQRRQRRGQSQAGFTAVQVAIAIGLSGSLLAVGVPTFQKAVRTSKVSEASESLQRMVLGAAAYYEGFHEIDGRKQTQCLPPSAGPVPAEPDPDGMTVHLERFPEAQSTFEALGFVHLDPSRYRFTFQVSRPGCDLGASVEAGNVQEAVEVRFIAEGDLDDDGILSRFTRFATPEGDKLNIDPLLQVERRIE